MKPLSLAACLAFAIAPSLHAALVATDTVNLNIPDGSSSGLVRMISITGTAQTITSATISLEISAAPGDAAFLGDLYVYLTNGTETAVLLNRPGRTSTAPAGYSDNQTLNVAFSDAASDDIHNYRLFVPGGSASTPLIAPLTGTWLPDGRTTDPASVLDSNLPSARLTAFNGAAVAGDWTLFVADVSGGAQHRLVSWSVNFEVVPEPSALLLVLGAVPMLLRRRRSAAAEC